MPAMGKPIVIDRWPLANVPTWNWGSAAEGGEAIGMAASMQLATTHNTNAILIVTTFD
jgi:hypothetical protein